MPESYQKFLDFLTVAEFSQALLLIFILLVMDKNRKANIFFAAFLFIISSSFFTFYLFKSDYKIISALFAILAVPGISASGVFIYLYVQFITGLIEKFRVKYLLNFTVYFLSLAFYILAVYHLHGGTHEVPWFKTVIFTVLGIGFINSIVYIFYTLINLKKYADKIENYYSDLQKISLNWLIKITTLSFMVLSFWSFTFWLSHLRIIPKSPVFVACILLTLIVIVFITAYYLVNQPEIFRKNVEMEHVIEDTADSSAAEKYARQSIDDRMQDKYLAMLTDFMETEKPYLEENITIKDLADEIDIPAHHLSIVINNRLGKNFYTFINEYRIKEAVSILNNPENSDANIIAIAFKSGFNSKSTFNSVFKKITGFTPSEYRNRGNFRSELAS